MKKLLAIIAVVISLSIVAAATASSASAICTPGRCFTCQPHTRCM